MPSPCDLAVIVPNDLVQTPGEAEGLWIRTDPVSGLRQLLIGNTVGVIRVLEYSF